MTDTPPPNHSPGILFFFPQSGGFSPHGVSVLLGGGSRLSPDRVCPPSPLAGFVYPDFSLFFPAFRRAASNLLRPKTKLFWKKCPGLPESPPHPSLLYLLSFHVWFSPLSRFSGLQIQNRAQDMSRIATTAATTFVLFDKGRLCLS